MEVNGELVKDKSSNDVMRKKLEAELRATEEIARIKQSVIEKRLAVELASLGEEVPLTAVAAEPVAVPAATPAATPSVAAPAAPQVTTPVASPEVSRPPSAPSAGIKPPSRGIPKWLTIRSEPRKSRPVKSTPAVEPEEEEIVNEEEAESEESEESEYEEYDDEAQPKKIGSFFKGVVWKWKKRLRSPEKEAQQE